MPRDLNPQPGTERPIPASDVFKGRSQREHQERDRARREEAERQREKRERKDQDRR